MLKEMECSENGMFGKMECSENGMFGKWNVRKMEC